MKSGIYSIECLITGEKYIGRTNNLNRRKNEQFNILYHNKHSSKKLQNLFNKYGFKNFAFNIEELCDVNKLVERENYYCKKYENILLNERKEPNSFLGENNPFYKKKHTKENRKKQSERAKKQCKCERNPNNKLSINDCIEIKKLLMEEPNIPWNKKYSKIVSKFNISEITVRKIKDRKYWCSEYIGGYKQWIQESDNNG